MMAIRTDRNANCDNTLVASKRKSLLSNTNHVQVRLTIQSKSEKNWVNNISLFFGKIKMRHEPYMEKAKMHDKTFCQTALAQSLFMDWLVTSVWMIEIVSSIPQLASTDFVPAKKGSNLWAATWPAPPFKGPCAILILAKEGVLVKSMMELIHVTVLQDWLVKWKKKLARKIGI